MSAERFSRSQTPVSEQSQRIRRFSTPSWEETLGTLELRTHNRKRLNDLFKNNFDRFRNYYDDVFLAYVTGEKLPIPDTNDPQNKIFSTHYRIIRETVTRTIEKPTHGWAKHIRNEKSSAKKK